MPPQYRNTTLTAGNGQIVPTKPEGCLSSKGNQPTATLVIRRSEVGSTIEPLLGQSEAIFDEGFDGVRRILQLDRQLFALRGCVIRQHVIRDILPPRGPPDATSHPMEVSGAQRRAHRSQAVVPVVATAQLQPQTAERQIHSS